MTTRGYLILIGGIFFLILLMNALFVVKQTEQALVLQFGRPVAMYGKPGLKFKAPFIQNVVFFDKRLLTFEAEPQELIAADKKRLIVDAFVRYRIVDLLEFYQSVRDEQGMNSRLRSIVESGLRQAVSRVPLRAVVTTDRARIMQDIRDAVNREMLGRAAQDAARKTNPDQNAAVRGNGYGVQIVDVRIMRADLPGENSEAIYRRMKTEREREAKEFRARGAEEAQRIRARADRDRTVLLAEAQKQSETIRGEGDSKAAKLYGDAAGRDKEFYQFYRAMQAYRKTLTNKDTTLVLSPGKGFLREFDRGGK